MKLLMMSPCSLLQMCFGELRRSLWRRKIRNGVKGRGQKGTQRPQFVPSNDMFRSIESLNQGARNLFTPSLERRRAQGLLNPSPKVP